VTVLLLPSPDCSSAQSVSCPTCTLCRRLYKYPVIRFLQSLISTTFFFTYHYTMGLFKFFHLLLWFLVTAPTFISAGHRLHRRSRSCLVRPPSYSYPQPNSTTLPPSSHSGGSTIAPSSSTLKPSATPPPTKPPVQSVNNNTPLTPNGIKAGIAGGDAYTYVEGHIGWWYDWFVSIL
jgi:hypothetical protein